MKFMMNGAPTIGTLDGANVEILREVGAENFFLFGLTAEEVAKRREDPTFAEGDRGQPALQDVLQMIAEGRFSPGQSRTAITGLSTGVWHHDYFLVAADFDAYHARRRRWTRPMPTRPLVADGGAEHGAGRVLLVRPHDPGLHGRDLGERLGHAL
jgi:glycogen phosphorylase